MKLSFDSSARFSTKRVKKKPLGVLIFSPLFLSNYSYKNLFNFLKIQGKCKFKKTKTKIDARVRAI